jgi:hypothetical protein
MLPDEDTYLWDRSGTPDPEIVRLEQLLAPMAHQPSLSPRKPTRVTRREPRRVVVLASAAALALAASIVAVVSPQAPAQRHQQPRVAIIQKTETPSCGEPTTGSWQFHTAGGPARCGNTETATGWMARDEILETTSASTATLDVATLGTVGLEPNTKLRLLKAEGEVQKLDLLRGTLHAKISAAPRLFVVKTPTADAVDLGCAYTISVDDDGKGSLEVTSGAVSLERQARAPTLVTQGASCILGAHGPGTPLAKTANATLRKAASDLDEGDASAFDRVVGSATKTDTLTLWHVMRRIAPEERARAYDKLARLVPPPRNASREAVVRGDHAAFAAYREALSSIWFAPE